MWQLKGPFQVITIWVMPRRSSNQLHAASDIFMAAIGESGSIQYRSRRLPLPPEAVFTGLILLSTSLRECRPLAMQQPKSALIIVLHFFRTLHVKLPCRT